MKKVNKILKYKIMKIYNKNKFKYNNNLKS